MLLAAAVVACCILLLLAAKFPPNKLAPAAMRTANPAATPEEAPSLCPASPEAAQLHVGGTREQGIFVDSLVDYVLSSKFHPSSAMLAMCCKGAAQSMKAWLAEEKKKAMLGRAGRLFMFEWSFKSGCKVFTQPDPQAPHCTCEIFELCFVPQGVVRDIGTTVYGTVARFNDGVRHTLTVRAGYTRRCGDDRGSVRAERLEAAAWGDWAFEYTYKVNHDNWYNVQAALKGLNASVDAMYCKRLREVAMAAREWPYGLYF